MQAIKPFLPDDARDVLALAPHELAAHVLKYLGRHRGEARRIRSLAQVPVFCLEDFVRAASGEQHAAQYRYPEGEGRLVVQAVLEAFNWLIGHGLVAVANEGQQDWYFVTRQGHVVLDAGNWQEFVESQRLPRELLHPTVERASWAAYIRGEYDTAVFSAFKQVEVAVREAGGFEADSYGTPLMRSAFHPENGPLTDLDAPQAEREALAHLFAGAIGSYKNPHSHRHVEIGPLEAGEMMVLAGHLLRILDGRQVGEVQQEDSARQAEGGATEGHRD